MKPPKIVCRIGAVSIAPIILIVVMWLTIIVGVWIDNALFLVEPAQQSRDFSLTDYIGMVFFLTVFCIAWYGLSLQAYRKCVHYWHSEVEGE